MKRGIVVAVHPGDHSVDILLSDGRRLVGVQVMSPNGSTRSGVFDMPEAPTRKDKWDISSPSGQDQIALVDFVDGFPVVTGFLFPQVSQMTFDDPTLSVSRHQSDVMTLIDGAGNIQIQHPNGTLISIGEGFVGGLDGKNTDKNLVIDRNTGRSVTIHMQTQNAKTTFTMTHEGEVSIYAEKEISIESQKTITMKAPIITLDAPVVNISSGMKVQGGTMTASGSISAVIDVIGAGKSLAHHIHNGVSSGNANTSPPV